MKHAGRCHLTDGNFHATCEIAPDSAVVAAKPVKEVLSIHHNFHVQIFSRFWTRCGNSRGLNFAILLMF